MDVDDDVMLSAKRTKWEKYLNILDILGALVPPSRLNFDCRKLKVGVLSCFLLKELGFVLEIAASLARDTPAFRRPQKVGWRTDDSQTVVVCATVRH